MTELYSTLKCPHCAFSKKEKMPVDACQFYYQCTQCEVLLKPLKGDCCVFCSYADVACPPIQQDQKCCG